MQKLDINKLIDLHILKLKLLGLYGIIIVKRSSFSAYYGNRHGFEIIRNGYAHHDIITTDILSGKEVTTNFTDYIK